MFAATRNPLKKKTHTLKRKPAKKKKKNCAAFTLIQKRKKRGMMHLRGLEMHLEKEKNKKKEHIYELKKKKNIKARVKHQCCGSHSLQVFFLLEGGGCCCLFFFFFRSVAVISNRPFLLCVLSLPCHRSLPPPSPSSPPFTVERETLFRR